MKTVDELKKGDLVRSFGQIWRVKEVHGDVTITFENTDKAAPMQEQAIIGCWKEKFATQGFEIVDQTVEPVENGAGNAGKTIILTINGTHFLLESDKALTADMKDEIEILCKSAFDEASDFVAALGNDKTLSDLCELSVYEIALLAQKVFRDKVGITAVFKIISLECAINTD